MKGLLLKQIRQIFLEDESFTLKSNRRPERATARTVKTAQEISTEKTNIEVIDLGWGKCQGYLFDKNPSLA